MRFGIVLLPQHRWRDDVARWRRAEEYGFDTAWTYDHLAWRSLVDEPWFGTVPVLAAAAASTSRIRLGTWVASPNYRHPVPFAKDVMTLDDVSNGRFVLGVGAGGTGVDATVLGGDVLPPRDRVDRLAEFAALLDLLLTEERTSWRGRFYEAVDARMLPGCVQRPRVPFVIAANGRRTMSIAATFGQGWATTGSEDVTGASWWDVVRTLSHRFGDVLEHAGRDAGDVERYLSLDSGGYALTSVGAFEDAVGRAAELGFTEVVTHWPRENGVYAGNEDVLDAVADRIPSLRGLSRG
jgi:alkanesulfonate monooxygenase SsuD/methylene tetrahydromethanopterin reductase-like flavin-dependent oxidoreductase (luciferase family)